MKYLTLLLLSTSLFAAEQTELLISAASSLKQAVETATLSQDLKVAHNFGSSGQLLTQILQNAPVDIFISASDKQVRALKEKDLIVKESESVIAKNTLVLATRNGLILPTLQDLRDSKIKRIALGTPGMVPAGDYAKQALTKSGLWDDLTAKFIFSKDVRAALTYVERGNVDAAIIFASDLISTKSSLKSLPIDPNLHEPIHYTAVILKTSKHPEQANAYLAFLKKSQAIFKTFGFAQ